MAAAQDGQFRLVAIGWTLLSRRSIVFVFVWHELRSTNIGFQGDPFCSFLCFNHLL